jgi:hypothetical protein
MSDAESGTSWLKRFLSDPMADAVRGTATILSVSEPTGRAPYAKCTLEVTAQAEGIEPRTVSFEAVLARKHWPSVGMVVPARIPPGRSDLVALDLEAFKR